MKPSPAKDSSTPQTPLQTLIDEMQVWVSSGTTRGPHWAERRLNLLRQVIDEHANLLSALKLAERRLTLFCDTPDSQGHVIAPDSVERLYLRDIRQVIAKVKDR